MILSIKERLLNNKVVDVQFDEIRAAYGNEEKVPYKMELTLDNGEIITIKATSSGAEYLKSDLEYLDIDVR